MLKDRIISSEREAAALRDSLKAGLHKLKSAAKKIAVLNKKIEISRIEYITLERRLHGEIDIRKEDEEYAEFLNNDVLSVCKNYKVLESQLYNETCRSNAKEEKNVKLAARIEELQTQATEAHLKLVAQSQELVDIKQKIEVSEQALMRLQGELSSVYNSTIWRASTPIRAIGRRLPTSLRRLLRRGLELVWWTVTLKLRSRLKSVRQSRAMAFAQVAIEPQVMQSEIALVTEPAVAVEAVILHEVPEASEKFESEKDALDLVVTEARTPDPVEAKPCGAFWEFSPDILSKAEERLARFKPFEAHRYAEMHQDLIGPNFSPAGHVVRFGGQEGRKLFQDDAVARAIGGLITNAEEIKADSKFPADAVQRVALGVYYNTQGNIFMKEIAEDLVADLRTCGANVQLLDETTAKDARPPVCLFVAPHEFYYIGEGTSWLRDDIVMQSFMLNTEQIQTSWFGRALPYLLICRGVIDICGQSAQLLAQTGIEAVVLRQGLPHPVKGLEPEDLEHPLFKILPHPAKNLKNQALTWDERVLDMSFFGAATPHREKFFARHASCFAAYKAFLYCRRSRTPLIVGGRDGGLTRLAAHVVAHSKISLNIHRDEFSYFEWHRIVKLGIYAGSIVVSEPCLPYKGFTPGVNYFEETSRYIPDLIDWLLKTPDGKNAAQKVRENNEALLRNFPAPRQTMAQVANMLWRGW